VLNFMPYIGGLIGVVLIGLVAIVSIDSLGHALLVARPRSLLAFERRGIPQGWGKPPRKIAAITSASRHALRAPRRSRCSTHFGDEPLAPAAYLILNALEACVITPHILGRSFS
jgi:hypothetical protein